MSTILSPKFKGFINEWDEAIEDWKSCCNTGLPVSSPLLNCFATIKCPPIPKDKTLFFDEIPEPFYLKVIDDGSTDINCVVVDLNPGMSAQSEHIKYSFNWNKDKMTLANYLFGHNFPAHKYSDWQNAFHITDPSAEGVDALKSDGWTVKDLPGYEWWRAGRVKFISRLIKRINEHKGQVGNVRNVCEPNLFAVELCPFHSKEWKTIDGNYCFDRQIEGAAMALDICRANHGLGFGLGFGKDVYVQMKRLGYVEVKEYDHNNADAEGLGEFWPKNKKGKNTNRSFVVLEWQQAPSHRFLVTYYSGGFITPAESFDDVILEILERNSMI